MAISKDKKQALVSELSELLGSAKMTVAAKYTGISVTELQQLRRDARAVGVTIKVVKNRLVRVALKESKVFAKTDSGLLEGQLLYAFSNEDEVAPAQVLAAFAKTHEAIQLVVAFDASGAALDTAAVTALAALPTKDQLRGQVVGVIAAPLTQMLGILSGTQRGFAQVLNQRSEQLA